MLDSIYLPLYQSLKIFLKEGDLLTSVAVDCNDILVEVELPCEEDAI